MLKKCICAIFVALIVVSIVLLIFFSLKQGIPEETGSFDLFFCPQDDCESILLEYIYNASKIHCAFYDVDAPIFDALKEKKKDGGDVSLVLEKDNKINGNFVSFDDRSAYMHNKFCIFDDSLVMTGSMNPTENGVGVNANNLVFIESKYLAANYEAEFSSFVSRDFGHDSLVKHEKILFNDNIVENYFCPEDRCEERILGVLDTATESIHFMQFSFTSDVIGDLLVRKSSAGIFVTGLFEKQQNSKWSERQKLLDAGLDVRFASNEGKLHHKVFIVDESIVIFGSMNPSKNGNEKNDENILIVHNKDVALQFMGVFVQY